MMCNTSVHHHFFDALSLRSVYKSLNRKITCPDLEPLKQRHTFKIRCESSLILYVLQCPTQWQKTHAHLLLIDSFLYVLCRDVHCFAFDIPNNN